MDAVIKEEQVINGQGVRLVKQSEGIEVPLLQPWEVEGEKELLNGKLLKTIEKVESTMKSLYNHTLTCTDKSCGILDVFNNLMDFRRRYLFPLLKEKNFALYEVIYVLILIYIYSQGEESVFMSVSLVGLSLSLKILNK
jgi:hypothetical protein